MKNIDPNTFSLTAVIVGIIATSDMSYPEMNALGNWFVLLGDYLITYAAQQYVIEQNVQRDSDFNKDINIKNELDYLYDAINKMRDELDKIKRS